MLWCPYNGPPIFLVDILEFELSFLFDVQGGRDSRIEVAAAVVHVNIVCIIQSEIIVPLLQRTLWAKLNPI